MIKSTFIVLFLLVVPFVASTNNSTGNTTGNTTGSGNTGNTTGSGNTGNTTGSGNTGNTTGSGNTTTSAANTTTAAPAAATTTGTPSVASTTAAAAAATTAAAAATTAAAAAATTAAAAAATTASAAAATTATATQNTAAAAAVSSAAATVAAAAGGNAQAAAKAAGEAAKLTMTADANAFKAVKFDNVAQTKKADQALQDALKNADSAVAKAGVSKLEVAQVDGKVQVTITLAAPLKLSSDGQIDASQQDMAYDVLKMSMIGTPMANWLKEQFFGESAGVLVIGKNLRRRLDSRQLASANMDVVAKTAAQIDASAKKVEQAALKAAGSGYVAAAFASLALLLV